MEPDEQSPTLDKNKLSALHQILGQKLQPILANYKTSSADYLHNMKIAFSNNNTVELARITHALKGSSRTLFAMQLANHCQQLETEIKNNNLEEIGNLLNSIETTLAETGETLSSFEKLKMLT